jgi:hypothetical protein
MTKREALALLDRLVRLSVEERRLALSRLPPPAFRTLAELWLWRAHGGQREPAASAGSGPGDWLIWLLMAGRNFGKTRAGAEWVWARARATPGARIALVGGNLGEVERVMIRGPSGLIACAGTGETTVWSPSARTLRFGRGAEAFAYSAERPEALRGPEHDFAWCDELAKWNRADETWDNLMLGLRRGPRPRALVTTTPRSVPLLRRIRGLERFLETRGTSRGNLHASGAFLAAMEAAYGGTRLGRQELEGELIEDVAGALWPRGLIEKSRVLETDPRQARSLLRMSGIAGSGWSSASTRRPRRAGRAGFWSARSGRTGYSTCSPTRARAGSAPRAGRGAWLGRRRFGAPTGSSPRRTMAAMSGSPCPPDMAAQCGALRTCSWSSAC